MRECWKGASERAGWRKEGGKEGVKSRRGRGGREGREWTCCVGKGREVESNEAPTDNVSDDQMVVGS